MQYCVQILDTRDEQSKWLERVFYRDLRIVITGAYQLSYLVK